MPPFDSIDERLKLLAQANDLACWTIVDAENAAPSIVDAQRLETLLGLERAPADCAALEMLLHPADRALWQNHRLQALEKRETGDFELRMRAPQLDFEGAPDEDNPAHWHWIRCQFLPLAERAIFVVVRDISARKSAETAHLTADLRYRALIDLSPQVVFTTLPNGHLNYLNSQAAQFIGLSDTRALGERWLAAIHPDDRERAASYWMECVQSGTPYDMEIRFLRAADASYRWHVARARPLLDKNGAISSWIGVAIDVDEIKQAQHQAEAQRQQTEQAARARDEFLAIVSHELRTPLSAILGWINLLKGGQLSADEAAQALQTIERNALSQAKIVEDVLDVARVVTGNLRIDRYRMDWCNVIEDVLQSVKNAARTKNIALNSQFKEPVWVDGDAGRLRQVVENLLSNALKFTPVGGTVNLDLRCDHQNAILTIRDTGQGISAEFLPHIWERFRQADASSTRRYGGLGVGLALVRQLVEAHGGTASAHSAGAGSGTTFCVQLPLSSQGEEALEFSNFHLVPRFSNRSILWVEDTSETRDWMTLALQNEGAQVRAVGDVTQARRALENERFDLILTDLQRPGEDGFTLLHWLQMRPPCPPVVMVSAHTDQRERALKAGFTGFVAKPVVADELLDAVQAALNRAN